MKSKGSHAASLDVKARHVRSFHAEGVARPATRGDIESLKKDMKGACRSYAAEKGD